MRLFQPISPLTALIISFLKVNAVMIGNKCSRFLLMAVNEGGYSNQVWDKIHLKSAIHSRSGGGGQAVGELFDGEQGDSHRLRSSWLTHRRRRGLNPVKFRSESLAGRGGWLWTSG